MIFMGYGGMLRRVERQQGKKKRKKALNVFRARFPQGAEQKSGHLFGFCFGFCACVALFGAVVLPP
jgi:hypothetical protein